MIRAAIFDMDGLLLESESKWRQAEVEVASTIGLTLTKEHLEATMGVRIREVTRSWQNLVSWQGVSCDELAEMVVKRVIELVQEDATCLPGVRETLASLAEEGIELALCSSSDSSLINAILGALKLTDTFSEVHSAEDDAYGKPHPMPYLVTAEAIGVAAKECLVFEDSLAGCISGKAASMTVVAVPDPTADLKRFAFCDHVFASLKEFDRSLLQR